jgi:endonuclease/exonuclease/phosphatase family metal-dependent hydrolase
MKLRLRARLGTATVLALATAVAPGTVAAAHDRYGHNKRQLTVMTQNLYLGSSLERATAATSTSEFVAAVAQIYGTAVATNFPERAEAIADTIAAEEPDLIGLQEVTRWTARSTASGAHPPSYDFLAILADELVERGLDYQVEAVSENANIGPVPLVAPAVGCPLVESAPSCVVTLQDRDVILVNNDTPRLRVRTSQSGRYAAQEALALPTGEAESFARGWTYVDGTLRGRKFRFVNTHLEVQRYATTQEAQAREFLAGPARAAGTVIAVGDFNSAANPGEESTDSYELLTAASFRDAWSRVNPDEPGLTCCQSSALTNTSSQLRTRIDLVLTRGRVRPTAAAVVGDARISVTTPPFWASDHAGVVATLRLH